MSRQTSLTFTFVAASVSGVSLSGVREVKSARLLSKITCKLFKEPLTLQLQDIN